MAVFTPVSAPEAQAFLRGYDEGELVSLEAILEGVENTNYRLETTHGAVVLTLFERRIRREDLPFCLGLTEHLAARGFPTPSPVRTRAGDLISDLNDRPAALVRWAAGAWPRSPSVEQAGRAGRVLALLHQDARDFPLRRDNPVGPEAWKDLRDRCAAIADGEYAQMVAVLSDELRRLADVTWEDLPQGPIHADYFPDNVLYDAGQVSGVIDFYFGCTGALAYDVAIALNAWGFSRAGEIRTEVGAALLGAYQEARPLHVAEAAALPMLCRAAAVRFALTRLHDILYHPAGSLVVPKDPADYLARLAAFRDEDATRAFTVLR